MGKRFVIGLIYLNDPNWMGGTYYLENIVTALKLLPPEDQPLLKIYCYSKDDFDRLSSKTSYEFISPVFLIYRNFLARICNAFSLRLFGSYVLLPHLKPASDVLFPANNRKFFDAFKNKVCWIPDFQEYHYPAFFSSQERIARAETYANIIARKWPILFSSKNAQLDFATQFPLAKNRTFVVPFAVTIPDLSGIHFDQIKDKYKLDGDYFISSNQFWVHKNHMVVIRAVQELKNRNIRVQLLFTGKPYDNRNPEYYSGLVQFVQSHHLEREIRFLGFIDRKDQLVLLKHSRAIIQPSLFEGWSTIVEDAKALHHPILVSDIPVHREQLGENFSGYFRPDAEQKLSQLMIEGNFDKFLPTANDYQNTIKDFAHNLLSSFKEVAQAFPSS